jgi:hypothetical protein
MGAVEKRESLSISKHRGRPLEADTVFTQVRCRFGWVPLKIVLELRRHWQFRFTLGFFGKMAMRHPARSKPIRIRPIPAKNSAKFFSGASFMFAECILAPFAARSQLRNDPLCNVHVEQGMFPNAQHSPTSRAQHPRCGSVSRAVSGDLALPILSVSLGHSAVPTAAMPKAAVHKDGEALLAENEIGLSGQRLLATPARDAVGAENGGELEFRVFVAVRTNRRHYLRPLLLAENICHGASISPRGRRVTEILLCEEHCRSGAV